MVTLSRRILILAAFGLVCFMFFAKPVFGDQTQAASAISVLQSQTVICYNAVKSAEASGANVTDLTNTMTRSAGFLSSAIRDYGVGEFDGATLLAEQGTVLLEGVPSQADGLRQVAVNKTATEDRYVLISVAGTIAVIICSAAFWLLFARRYRTGVQ